jgi:hypothetical protein
MNATEVSQRFCGWYREHRCKPWRKVCEGESYDAAFDALLSSVQLSSDLLVLPANRVPEGNFVPPRAATTGQSLFPP